MIRDWQLAAPPSAAYPIGEPFTARKSYMSVFCVLEALAMGRLTDSELGQVSAGIHIEAYAEMERREALGDGTHALLADYRNTPPYSWDESEDE